MTVRAHLPSTLLGLLTAACATPDSDRPTVTTWGTMREVLRERQSEGRVALAGLGAPGAIGVGALAGLAGEVTIVDERVLVARADGESCVVAEAAAGEQAALLVRAVVPAWQRFDLPDCASYEELDAAIARELDARGFDRASPTPVRVSGRGRHVEYHVIAGACPIADPAGPPPWRFAGQIERLEIVGVYVEGAAGQLTHHMHDSHLHVVAPGRTGHLDEIALTGAVLSLPRQNGR